MREFIFKETDKFWEGKMFTILRYSFTYIEKCTYIYVHGMGLLFDLCSVLSSSTYITIIRQDSPAPLLLSRVKVKKWWLRACGTGVVFPNGLHNRQSPFRTTEEKYSHEILTDHSLSRPLLCLMDQDISPGRESLCPTRQKGTLLVSETQHVV